MDQQEVQKKVETFLHSLGVPGVIVFGWQKTGQEYGFVSSAFQIPPAAAVKGLTWALNDFVQKTL